MKLSNVRQGQWIRIVSIEDPIARVQAIRLGVGEGSISMCLKTLFLGPVVLRHGSQDIAFGRRLAEKIHVTLNLKPVINKRPGGYG